MAGRATLTLRGLLIFVHFDMTKRMDTSCDLASLLNIEIGSAEGTCSVGMLVAVCMLIDAAARHELAGVQFFVILLYDVELAVSIRPSLREDCLKLWIM